VSTSEPTADDAPSDGISSTITLLNTTSSAVEDREKESHSTNGEAFIQRERERTANASQSSSEDCSEDEAIRSHSSHVTSTVGLTSNNSDNSPTDDDVTKESPLQQTTQIKAQYENELPE